MATETTIQASDTGRQVEISGEAVPVYSLPELRGADALQNGDTVALPDGSHAYLYRPQDDGEFSLGNRAEIGLYRHYVAVDAGGNTHETRTAPESIGGITRKGKGAWKSDLVAVGRDLVGVAKGSA